MKTVLLVDDDPLVLKTLSAAFEEKGLTVLLAHNGKEGLDVALKSHPDLVISDVRMPEMDGLAMVETLRKDDWGKHVPIAMLTSDDTTTSINQALEQGVTVYLSKSHLDVESVAQQALSLK